MPADLNFNESVAWGMQFTRTSRTAIFGMSAGLHRGRRHTNTGHVRAQGLDTLRRCHQRQWKMASLHRGPPTPTRATSGHEDWIPLNQMPPPWMPIRTYTRGFGAEWHKDACLGAQMLRPGLLEHWLEQRPMYFKVCTVGKARICPEQEARDGRGGACSHLTAPLG